MSCWTVARYVARATGKAAHHVWHGRAVRRAMVKHLHITKPAAAGLWKTVVVCSVGAGGVAGAVGGAHLAGIPVPFPDVTAGQLRDALCCGQSPLTHVQGPPGTWASGVTGFAGYPDRPVRKVPEPASLLLLATGIVAIAAVRRRT